MVCTDCDYVAYDSITLAKHFKSAHTVRDKSCYVCEMAFTTTNALEKHARDVHDTSKCKTCPHCGYSCKYGGTMINHIKALHRNKKVNLTANASYYTDAPLDLSYKPNGFVINEEIDKSGR